MLVQINFHHSCRRTLDRHYIDTLSFLALYSTEMKIFFSITCTLEFFNDIVLFLAQYSAIVYITCILQCIENRCTSTSKFVCCPKRTYIETITISRNSKIFVVFIRLARIRRRWRCCSDWLCWKGYKTEK